MLPNKKKSNNQSNRNPQSMPNSAINIPKGKIPRQDLIYCKIKNKKSQDQLKYK